MPHPDAATQRLVKITPQALHILPRRMPNYHKKRGTGSGGAWAAIATAKFLYDDRWTRAGYYIRSVFID